MRKFSSDELFELRNAIPVEILIQNILRVPKCGRADSEDFEVVYSSGWESRSGKAGQPPDSEPWVGGSNPKD